jgi:uncharacterized protein
MTDHASYENCQLMIDDAGAECSVAEAHGIMTGMLCVDQWLAFEQWQNEMKITELFADDLEGPALGCMTNLFDNTRANFADGDFEFSPCLPDDEIPLGQRAQALSEWCQGFLHGLGRADVSKSWPGQCNEVIRDLIAISEVDSEAAEDDEDSLMELVEYVRVGVELIRIELQQIYDAQKIH